MIFLLVIVYSLLEITNINLSVNIDKVASVYIRKKMNKTAPNHWQFTIINI